MPPMWFRVMIAAACLALAGRGVFRIFAQIPERNSLFQLQGQFGVEFILQGPDFFFELSAQRSRHTNARTTRTNG